MYKKIFGVFIILLWCVSISAQTLSKKEQKELQTNAEQALEKAIRYYHSTAVEGGYVYFHTPDLRERWGETRVDENTIEVQSPGTPAVGLVVLEAYKVTGNDFFLQVAKDAGLALAKGQNELGGWSHTIDFDRVNNGRVSFDDNQTQGAISFLMALDQEVDDPKLDQTIDKALAMMIETQMENGGWPHMYPPRGNYHDYATFNDQGINDCIRVMMEADHYYKDQNYKKSLDKAGNFLMISQLPPPQPGWAQQYNQYLQPAWARSFEPPSVCPSASLHNINSLLDLYHHTGSRHYLEAIPDALDWINSIQLPNGKWARFVELYTNKPLYYDRGRIRVNSTDELSEERRTGYGYENDLTGFIATVSKRYQNAINGGRENVLVKKTTEKSMDEMVEQVQNIISQLDEEGRWINRNEKYKPANPGKIWDGKTFEQQDRISSAVFIRNVNLLNQFLSKVQQ